MTGRRLRVLPDDEIGGLPGRFGPDHDYASMVWVAVLGPASFMCWQRMARRLVRRPEGFESSHEELAAMLGLGSSSGSRSGINRALDRLERFRIVVRPTDDVIAVRRCLPVLTSNQVARLHPLVRRLHECLRGRDRLDRAS